MNKNKVNQPYKMKIWLKLQKIVLCEISINKKKSKNVNKKTPFLHLTEFSPNFLFIHVIPFIKFLNWSSYEFYIKMFLTNKVLLKFI